MSRQHPGDRLVVPGSRSVRSSHFPTRGLLLAAITLVPMLGGSACAPEPEGGMPSAASASAAAAGENASVPMQRTPSSVDPAKPLRAGFLIVDGVYNSELMAPYDIFHHTVFHTQPNPGIEVFTVSPDGQPITTFEGLVITPHYGFANAPSIDILVVPSAENSMGRDLEDETMMNWVRTVGNEADFALSLCDGAFVLAGAGLLEGRAVTTFPGDQDHFAEMFPTLDLRRSTTFVHDGSAITSEGGAKSYDPALYLVDHIYGESVARGVAAGLIIAWPPVTWDATIIAP